MNEKATWELEQGSLRAGELELRTTCCYLPTAFTSDVVLCRSAHVAELARQRKRKERTIVWRQIFARACITWPFRATGAGANAEAAATTAAAIVARVNVMMIGGDLPM